MTKTKQYLAAFGVGFLFSIGLGISGMTLPLKVIGFLDFTGAWDPALAFVMGGAVVVYFFGYRLVTKRHRPRFADRFRLPTRTEITPRLMIGATLFGLGWGLGGFCPGPAFTSIPSGAPQVLTFVAAMLGGMYLHGVVDSALKKRSAPAADPEPAATADRVDPPRTDERLVAES